MDQIEVGTDRNQRIKSEANLEQFRYKADDEGDNLFDFNNGLNINRTNYEESLLEDQQD